MSEYMNVIKKMSEAITSFSTRVSGLVSQALKLYSKTTIPWLQSLYDDIPQMSENRKQELQKFCEMVLSNGWVLSTFLPVDVYNMEFKSKESINKYFL